MLLFLDSVPYIIIFVFGIVIGSFLNVCIYRLPLHESIITAPSHCMRYCKVLQSYFSLKPYIFKDFTTFCI